MNLIYAETFCKYNFTNIINFQLLKVVDRGSETQLEVAENSIDQLNWTVQFVRCPFFKSRDIFRHLKLDVALTIAASNDEK